MEKKKYNAPKIKEVKLEMENLMQTASAGGGSVSHNDSKASSSFDMSYDSESKSAEDDESNK